MPANGNRICPQCGRQALNPILVLCPECRVPFIKDPAAPQYADAAAQAWSAPSAGKVGGTNTIPLWTMLVAGLACICLVSYAFAWRMEKNFRARSDESLLQIQSRNSNELARAVSAISNQILAQLAQPKMQSAIDKAARDQVNRVVNTHINPALRDFLGNLSDANAQLADATNALGELREKILAAQRQIPTNPPPAPALVAAPAPVPAEPAPAAKPVKLTVLNQGITQSSTGYILTVVFQCGPVGGNVDMMVATYKQTARILNFSSINAVSAENPTLNQTADVAELKFVMGDNATTSVVLVVSAPTIVRFVSDQLDVPLTIPIAAEKLSLGTGTRTN